MNLDELQSVQSRERQTDSLQQLRASFYEDAAEFVQGLREEREQAAARAEDPFDSPDVNRLSDDIRTAEQTVEAIYERRVGKVVKMASLAAADMPTEQEGLTKEEQALFETMVAAIEDHRETILDVLGGDAPAGAVSSQPRDDRGPTGATTTTPPDEEESVDAAAVMGEERSGTETGGETGQSPAGEAVPDEAPAHDGNERSDSEANVSGGSTVEGDPRTDSDQSDARPGGAGTTEESEISGASGETGTDATASEPPTDTERVTVRITEDVGEIFGVDEREYDLARDDVVTLPTTNAEPLIDRDAAEPIE